VNLDLGVDLGMADVELRCVASTAFGEGARRVRNSVGSDWSGAMWDCAGDITHSSGYSVRLP
jgi:hypothetical protein